MLVKSVASKVTTVLAYDIARISVGCQLRCRPRHLTTILNYEAILAVLKLLTEAARNRQLETFKPKTRVALCAVSVFFLLVMSSCF